MNHEILKKHNELVVQIADSIDADWRRIVMSYEQEGEPGSLTQDTLLFYIQDTQNGLEKVSVKDPSEESGTGLASLNTLMADPSGESWSGCELIIDADGKYNFSFSYGPPKRINGIYDEQSYGRFRSYLDLYKAELAVAKIT